MDTKMQRQSDGAPWGMCTSRLRKEHAFYKTQIKYGANCEAHLSFNYPESEINPSSGFEDGQPYQLFYSNTNQLALAQAPSQSRIAKALKWNPM